MTLATLIAAQTLVGGVAFRAVLSAFRVAAEGIFSATRASGWAFSVSLRSPAGVIEGVVFRSS